MQTLLVLLPTLLSLLSQFFGSKWTNLAGATLVAIESIIAELKAGNNSVTITIATTLQAVITEAQAVQAVGGLAPADEAVLTESIAVIDAGLVGVEKAEAGQDPSTLPIPPAV